jgi:hypothetical protein
MSTTATPWEEGKDILVQEIGSGKIPRTMGPKDVHGLRLEHRAVEYKNFRTNLVIALNTQHLLVQEQLLHTHLRLDNFPGRNIIFFALDKF